MPESSLSLDTQDGVAVITMSRAPVNALSRAFVDQLSEAAQQCESYLSCRVIVIASGLPKVFCAGADIRELEKSRGAPDGSFIKLGQRLMDRLEALPKPIIAAVRGVCVGGGCELAMACDLRGAAIFHHIARGAAIGCWCVTRATARRVRTRSDRVSAPSRSA